jgi:hypothetical protein
MLRRFGELAGASHADPFPDYAVSPPGRERAEARGAGQRDQGSPSKGHQGGLLQDACVQEDGSIIMQPGYINTAKSGENCQKQQIAAFIASVQHKSPGKLRIPGLESPARRSPKARVGPAGKRQSVPWAPDPCPHRAPSPTPMLSPHRSDDSSRSMPPRPPTTPASCSLPAPPPSSPAAVSPGPRSGDRRLEDAGGRKHAVLDARGARDMPCGADSASSTRHEIKEASFDHARYSQSSAGASQHLLEDEMSQAETTVRTAEQSSSRMWSEAVPGDETAGESEGEAFFDDVITCQIAGLADVDPDEAGEFDDIPDVHVLEPSLVKQVASRAPRDHAPADAQKTAGAVRSAQAAAGSSKGGNHWQLSPAAARAQEECLGTSQAMLDAQFALEYGAGLRE